MCSIRTAVTSGSRVGDGGMKSTWEYSRNVGVLTVPVLLNGVKPINDNFMALIDTGATVSSIHPDLVRSLQLKEAGESKHVFTTEHIESPVYYCDIRFNDKIELKRQKFVAISKNWHVIIGMDILRHCNLSITNSPQQTILELEFPNI